jgi:signal transduction histidine kinase
VQYRNRQDDPGSLSSDRVWFVMQSRDGAIWAATSNGGVNRLMVRENRFVRYTEANGLGNNMVCGILEDDRGRLWISTNNGISRLDPPTGRIKNFNVGDGLPIYEFHFKACGRDRFGTMYFGGNNGVLYFHPDSIQENRFVPPVALTSFHLYDLVPQLDTLIEAKRLITLEHDQNSFSFEFASLDFTNPLRNRFRYRLEGFDRAWRTSDSLRHYASYTNVPPGSYVFRVVASNSDGVWNTRGTSLMVTIEPAFWQTSWFRVLTVLLLTAAVVTVIGLRIRVVQRKAELERKLVGSQLRALQAQMNPHFIFNSLNAILHFVTTHDASSAHKYLSKFSKLIRSILDASRRDTMTLAEELDALRLYLDLEALRFDELFDYTIEIDPSIETEHIEIPPMLIQPYVENAINHGLRYRSRRGQLMIRMRQIDGRIVCSVIDNGIGRKRSKEMKTRYSSPFKSVGMQVTQERLEILNAMHGSRFGVSVTDLLDEHDDPAGTQVDISIPVN